MSARDDLIDEYGQATTAPPGTLSDLRQKLDDYRAEILREEMTNLRRIEREETPEGALGTRTGLLRAALILDERAETIREKAAPQGAAATPHTEAFDGELAMLRGLVRVLRTVVRENDTLPEVRRLLWEHASDDAAAREGKSSRPAADATPTTERCPGCRRTFEDCTCGGASG